MEAEKKTIAWHSRTIQEVADVLETSTETGLASDKVSVRLTQYGPNELAERPRPGFWQLLLAQFNNFIIMILIIAAVVSLLLGETIEAGAIMAIVILNAVLGVVQEGKAEEAQEVVRKALSALDRAAQKGVIHRNNAARRKSRLVKQLNEALQA